LGEFANSHLRNVAKHICELVKGPDRTDYKLENEGTESSKFKEAIGGDLNGHAKHETRPNNLPVKFFLCSNANKQYRADRSAHFVQSDLSHSHQAILDRYSEVLVWIGRDTKPEDKKIALEVAIDYVEKANDGRKACPVLVLDEGFVFVFVFALFEQDEILQERKLWITLDTSRLGIRTSSDRPRRTLRNAILSLVLNRPCQARRICSTATEEKVRVLRRDRDFVEFDLFVFRCKTLSESADGSRLSASWRGQALLGKPFARRRLSGSFWHDRQRVLGSSGVEAAGKEKDQPAFLMKENKFSRDLERCNMYTIVFVCF
jgi:hypothetical protein